LIAYSLFFGVIFVISNLVFLITYWQFFSTFST